LTKELGVDTVNSRSAKVNLSPPVERTAAGEKIIRGKAGRPLGMFKGQMAIRDDFDAPLPDALAAAFRGDA
jgi:hypothetical protein